MAKMASYEEHGGKKDKAVAGYFRGDYIGSQLIISIIVMTVAFAMIVGAYLAFNFEDVMANIYTMDLVEIGKKLMMAYLIIMIVYLIVTYIVYRIRYTRARKRLNVFYAYLNRLDGTEEEDDI